MKRTRSLNLIIRFKERQTIPDYKSQAEKVILDIVFFWFPVATLMFIA